MMVANSTSQGTRAANTELGVHNSSSAPTNPPTRLTTASFVTLTSVTSKTLRRYAQALVKVAGNSATTLDALATMGLRPANSNAGNVTSDPPPASALRAPPRNAVAVRTMMVITSGCARFVFCWSAESEIALAHPSNRTRGGASAAAELLQERAQSGADLVGRIFLDVVDALDGDLALIGPAGRLWPGPTGAMLPPSSMN
jgi:hypothetical protein